jgi:hypothetical protein
MESKVKREREISLKILTHQVLAKPILPEEMRKKANESAWKYSARA